MRTNLRTRLRVGGLGVVILALGVSSALAEDLTNLSLEELLDVEVTSVGKKAQSLSDAAAAVFVISNDDIRRSGATSVPEALRMVPGLQVARLDANKWAISARGFNGRFANKLLVLIDGRTVYTPSFSGVYWENQEVMLADVERIEVIRGPGATLWGANAVNGVINIITKTAAATTGGLLVAGAGTEERALVSLRYGGEPAPGTFARAYVKFNDTDSLVTELGRDGDDEWDIAQGGFRVDSALSSGDQVTFQGDVYTSDLSQQLLVPDPSVPPTYHRPIDDQVEASGWNLLGRWERALSVTSDLSVQAYYDHAQRSEFYVSQSYDIFDLEMQQRVRIGERNDVLWGLGYRHIEDWFGDTYLVTLDPLSDNRDLWSGFVQDDIELIQDRLRLTLGIKFEQNAYTDTEVQPNIRLLWKPSEQYVLWGSVSRAVRTPSRAERSGNIWSNLRPTGAPPPFPPVMVIETVGNSDYGSEALMAYELGVRLVPSRRLHLDLALFYNDYDELRTVGDGPWKLDLEDGFPVAMLPFGNGAAGESYGAELALDYQAQDWWRIALAYSFLELDLSVSSDSQDQSYMTLARSDPRQQLSLRSMMNLRPDIDLDLWLRYVDQAYPAFSSGRAGDLPIPAYWNLDVRLAWQPKPQLEIELVGQNLLSPSHQEGYAEVYGADPLEVQRGIYLAVLLNF